MTIKFNHWSPGPNYHRWYFDDKSYIEATRHSHIHSFKISESGEDCIASDILLDCDNRNNTPLMESIYFFTDINLAL